MRINDQQRTTFSPKVRQTLLEGLDAYSGRPFIKSLSQSRAQYDVPTTGLRNAIENEATSVYIPVDVLYAEKPGLDQSLT